MEDWRPVIGYEGQYEVSEYGAVRSRRRSRLTTHEVGGGYVRVQLYRDGRKHNLLVASIVARAFLGPCPPGMEVNHKSGDKHDNGFRNLEYLTRPENIQHSRDVLGNQWPQGEQHGMARLTEVDVRQIRELLSQRMAQGAIAARFQIHQTMVSRIALRKAWRHVA